MKKEPVEVERFSMIARGCFTGLGTRIRLLVLLVFRPSSYAAAILELAFEDDGIAIPIEEDDDGLRGE